jgi:hypothetical protein
MYSFSPGAWMEDHFRVRSKILNFFTKVAVFVNVISAMKCGTRMSICHAVGGMVFTLEEAVVF